MPWEPEHIGELGKPCEETLMRLRFPDTGLLPHPVGLVDFKEIPRELLYRKKYKCSKTRGSRLTEEKLRILKTFFFAFPDGAGK
jgi:hypothetical protein